MERRNQGVVSHFLSYLVLITLSFLMVSCDQDGSSSVNIEDKEMYEVSFVEQEKGVQPYPVRMLMTKGYLRIDEGEKSDGYILYDRKQQQIISVSIGEKRVYKMPQAEVQSLDKPENLNYRDTMLEDDINNCISPFSTMLSKAENCTVLLKIS